MVVAIACFSLILAPSGPSLAGEIAKTDAVMLPVTPALPAASVPSAPKAYAFVPSHDGISPVDADEPASPDMRTDAPDSLSALVARTDVPADMDEQLRCLAGAVYFESKGESLSGQLAVAHVVINRARSGRFASSLCGVVHQPGQFSFVRGGSMPSIPTASRGWREAAAIAQIALADAWENPVQGALFFHARHVAPGWKLRRVAAIDNHIFYR